MKFKKRRKSSRFRGTHTHGTGFKKKARGKGHQGGMGMAGSGKRADHKKTLILNLPYEYFGRDKVWRKKIKKKLKIINISQILEHLPSYLKSGKAKESKDHIEMNLEGYKILGEAQKKLDKRLILTASAASEEAKKKVQEAGGEIKIIIPIASKETKTHI